jgi:predicted small integral membrane protein
MASTGNGNPTDELKRSSRRQGFLPITTNTFDRVFISIVCFVAINLLWFRFVEAYLPIHVATVISLALAFVIIKWG